MPVCSLYANKVYLVCTTNIQQMVNFRFSDKIAALLLVSSLLSCPLLAQSFFTIGTCSSANADDKFPSPFPLYKEGSRQQYLILASEIIAEGATAGYITSISYVVLGNAGCNDEIPHYTMKMGHTSLNSLTAIGWANNLTTVYGPVLQHTTSGSIMFSNPFYWNGTSNVILEICTGDPANGSITPGVCANARVCTSNTSFNSSRGYGADNLGNLCGSQSADGSLQVQTDRPRMGFGMNEVNGIGEVDRSHAIADVYPSVVKDKVVLDLHTGSSSTVTICSVSGVLLKRVAVAKGANSIDLSSLPAGLVFLNVSDGVRTYSYKIIKL
jgi:hypothetical protein